LHVERNRVFAGTVGAFEVAEFDDLVMNKTRKTISDDEVTFSFSNWQAAGECW